MFFSEGLFLALSMGALLLAERGNTRRAALVGVAVAATRTLGVLVIVPLVLAQLQRGERRARELAVSLAPLVGMAVVMVAQWVQVGDPLSFASSSKGWGRETSLPVTTVLQRMEHALSNPLTLLTVLDVAALAIALACAVQMTRALRSHRPDDLVLPWSMVAWTWLMIVAPLSSGLAFSWARYMLAAWPVFLVVAHHVTRRPVVVQLAIGGSLAALTVFEAIAWHEGQFIG
jgi:hypothetical protein